MQASLDRDPKVVAQSMDVLSLPTVDRLFIIQTEVREEWGTEEPTYTQKSANCPQSASPPSHYCHDLIIIIDLPFSNMTILNGSFTVDFTPFLNRFALQTIIPSSRKKGNKCADSSLRRVRDPVGKCTVQWLCGRYRPHTPLGGHSRQDRGLNKLHGVLWARQQVTLGREPALQGRDGLFHTSENRNDGCQ